MKKKPSQIFSKSSEEKFRRQPDQKITELETKLAAERKRCRELSQELKRIEANENENRYRSLFDSMQEGFMLAEVVFNKAGNPCDYRLLEVNRAFGRLTGFSLEAAQGKTILQLVPNADPGWLEIFNRVVLSQEPAQFERHSPFLNRWFSVRAFCPEKGKLACMFIDITPRKRAEEALRQSELFHRQALESIPGMVFTTRPDGYCDYQSQQWVNYTGVPASEQLDEGWNKLLHPDDRTRAFSAWQAAVKGRAPYDLEYRVRRRDGAYEWFKVIGRPIRNGEGEIIKWFGVAMNIEALKQAEEHLRHLNENLEQRVAERTELAEARAKQLQGLVSQLTIAEQRERRRLGEILHDHLQQLLVAAKINTEVLSARIGKEYRQAAENTIDLIDQSIQASRSLTAELSPPFLRKGGLSAGLKWLAAWMQEKHGITVKLQTAPGLDPEREDVTVLIFQSIRELLFNVVKHAKVQKARVKMVRDRENRLRVAVIDQGSGFNPATIWEKAQAGAGFGIFSIRERLELLGGSLEIESSPGKGAAFALIVPLEATKKKIKKRIKKPVAVSSTIKKRGDKIRVLLADEHTVVRQGLSTTLNLHADIEVVGEASDGEVAVRMSRELKPDVILMDISMPVMDGIEATRIIHTEFPHIRIIGLSMYDEQAAHMIEAGASDYCPKGCDTRVLLSTIRAEAERPCEKASGKF